MDEIFFQLTESPLFGISLSVGAYALGSFIQKKTKSPIANPLLIAIGLVIIFLKITGTPLSAYNQGGGIISMMLPPATAVLAVSIYRQWEILKKNLLPVICGCAAGSIASMGSIYLLCRLMKLDRGLTYSLLPKSVTTPIAVAISGQSGGLPSVTVCAVIVTGIFGSIAAPYFIKYFRITDPIAAGIGIGSCSHAMGTSKALEIGEIEGAMSGIAIGVSGLMTVLFSILLT